MIRLAQRTKVIVSVTVVVAVGALALFALRELLAEVHVRDIRTAVQDVTWGRVAAAALLTVASYLCLTLYDVFALQTIRKPLPYRTAALASFISYTLSHNLGLALFTGGAARYRVYSAAGLLPADIARVVAIAGATFWGGILATSGLVLLLIQRPIAIFGFTLGADSARLIGGIALAAVLASLVGAGFARSIKLFRWRLPIPTPARGAMQIAVAALDLALACSVLFVLIPGMPPSQWTSIFIAYVLAVVFAVMTHVPGGIGVFEAIVIALVPDVPLASLVAGLLLYRLIYYIAPLFVAATMIAVIEGRRWRRPVAHALGLTHAMASTIAPALLAGLTFAGGSILLVSGALPAEPSRLAFLRAIVPLPFAEASQIAASIVGTALLVLSQGLYRRSDSAHVLTRALLVAGILFALLKGFDYEEAVVLAIIASLLQWTRASFYRRTVATTQLLDVRWLAAAAGMIGLSLWVGFFVHRHVEYQNELWWRFDWQANSARFLRASLAAAIVLVAATLWKLTSLAGVKDSETASFNPTAILSQADRTDAYLALTGDKRFVATDDAFIMYQIQGRSFLMMGDPVGNSGAFADLVWQLRELADRAAGRLAMYQITAASVPFAIDLGLSIVKYGEEARVLLAEFTLERHSAKSLRQRMRHAERGGASFAILPASEVRSSLAELERVSDAWLNAKGQREKRFSVGWFDPEYLERFPVAIIRVEDRIVAFANVVATANRNELSIDLMRYDSDVPSGTMDYLFCSLLLWGRENGYTWFSLGIAPLSGLAHGRLAPLWSRVADFIFRHGHDTYNFEGLRAFKGKYAPVWEPRYLAAPAGPGFARALLDLKRLVSA